MKRPPANVRRKREVQSVGQEDPLDKGMELTPLFLPGECLGQTNLVG